MLLALLGCSAGDDSAAAAASGTPTPLPPAALLSRLSLDLRGRRPTEDEIARVEDDPAAIDTLVDEFLQDEGFGERLVSLYGDLYKTRADFYVVGADGDADLMEPTLRALFMRSVGEEPLRMLQRIADDDLPYTDFVTADWTMTNERLTEAWPVTADEEGDGWVKGHYTDDRPAAGVLATNGLWWRYGTTVQNANRGRAEAVAQLFVCDKRFDQPVEFKTSTDVLDRDELVDRIQTDPACIGCHVMLDPIGSYLYGFYRNHPESYSEAAWYYPGREGEWSTRTGVAPAWYGVPGDSLYDLGQQIAADPRYVNCAVEQNFTFLNGHAPTFDDTTRLTQHRDAFIDGGLTLRSLYRSLVSDPQYRSEDETVDGVVTPKRLSPDQLASAVEALTGYRWQWNGIDFMVNDTYGLRILAGGMDGMIVTQPATDHSTTSLLVEERLAEAASAYAVAREAPLAATDRILFREVALGGAVPSDDEVTTQVEKLVVRVLGRRAGADDADVTALVGLWNDTYTAGGDPDRAWTVVLSALLRHPDFIQY